MLNYLFIALMLFIGFGPMVWEMKKNKFDFFNLKNPFIIYFILQLGISGLISIYFNIPSEIGLDPIEHSAAYQKALLISLLGLIVYYIGYYHQKSISFQLPRIYQRTWNNNRLKYIIPLYFTIGLFSFIFLINMNGGFTEFFNNRESWRTEEMKGQGFLIFPATGLLSFATMIYLANGGKDNSKNNHYLKYFIVLGIALVPSFMLGFRGFIGLPIIQFMLIWNYYYKKISILKLSLLLSVMIIVFTIYGISRVIPLSLDISVPTMIDIVKTNPELISSSLATRSKGTETVASVISKLDETGDYEYGWRNIIEALTIFIPRFVWEGKPEASSEKFTTYFFGDELRQSRNSDRDVWGGVSPTAVGELYWHFGYAGVLLGLYLLGRLAKIVYVTFKRNMDNKSVMITYAVFFSSYTMFAEFMQGYINGLVLYLILIIITLVILQSYFIKRHHRVVA